MKNFFKPEDFKGIYGNYQDELHIEYCRIANKKLQELMKDAEVLVEALSEAIESFPKDLQHQHKAYRALATWNAKYGEKK